jgi:SAM-dependent methyltransferase
LTESGADQWEANAEADAFWAILTDPGRSGRRWGEREFFETGRVEWQTVRGMLAQCGALPDFSGRYLDFGCGVGRISRQLAGDFRDGLGVDISERMVTLARSLNPGLRFAVNQGPGLSTIGTASIAFVYSHIVLQHIAADAQKALIREFLRVLVPGGVAAFQVTTELVDPRPALRRVVSRASRPIRGMLSKRSMHPEGPVQMSMNVLPHEVVRSLIELGGATLIAAPYSNSTDPGHNGVLQFTGRTEALDRVRGDLPASWFLSRFYVVRAPLAVRRQPSAPIG